LKILAINGSPKGTESNTDVLVQTFLEGAREEGADTETVYVRDLKVTPCTGCFSCWTKTPGVCIHRDDMQEMLLRIRESDILVLASPLYGNMVTGILKNFMDRMVPLSSPAIEKIGDEYNHPARYKDGISRFVLISNAGFPETHHFEALKTTFRQLDSGPRAGLAGMICCAAGPMLTTPGMRKHIQWYLDATRQAGRQVARGEVIRDDTQAILDRSLAEDPGAYAGAVNAHWRSEGADIPQGRASVPASAEEPAQLIDSDGVGDQVRDLLAQLAGVFSAEAAGDLEAVFQFEIPDEDPGHYFLKIGEGVCGAYEGVHASPTLTIHAPAQIWLDVCSGKLDGTAAYMSGQYRVSGDLSMLMRFGSLFSSS